MRFSPFVVTFAIAVSAPRSVSAQVIYTVTDLGSFGRTSNALAVNIAGQVTGSSFYPDLPNGQSGPVHAYRTAPNGRISDPGTDLGTLPGGNSQSYGYGINAAGQVTGSSETVIGGTGTIHAFRTTGTGLVSDPGTDLGVIGGPTPGTSLAFAINTTGQVAGWSSTATSTSHAFRSTPTGQPVSLTDLGVFPGGAESFGMAINDSGQVAGYSEYALGSSVNPAPTRAFRTTAVGVLTDPGADLGTLGGSQSRAFGINASGQVIGRSFTAFDVAQHAFRSTPNGQPVSLTDLGTLGGTNSEALAINSFGVVVGDSSVAPGFTTTAAFIYDTQMRDLNSFLPPNSGWFLSFATGINDLGQITALGTLNGQGHALLLTPMAVPEPAALLLTSAAAAAFACRRWRRRRIAAGRRAVCSDAQYLLSTADRGPRERPTIGG
jgi:probable HAF family extracellular repeat protein